MDLQKKYHSSFELRSLPTVTKRKLIESCGLTGTLRERRYHVKQEESGTSRFLDQLFQFPDALTHDDLGRLSCIRRPAC